MARPADWWVLNLDRDPTPGDPVRLRQLASRFHDFAETAHQAKLAVESLQGDGAILAWVGMSGDAFREQFGEFPTQVNKLYRSHLMVGDALDAYAPVLETAQAQADRALADGRVAAEKLTSLQGALSAAQADATYTQRAQQAQQETQQPDPEQVKQAVRNAETAQQRLSGAQSQVNGAQHELDLAKQLAEQAKQTRDGAARTCQREIEDASDAGIQPRSFWQKLGDALKQLWNIICEVAKWVALVAGVIAMIIGGPLAWVALAAGAILLVKAVVDFAQGKGSVMDLVFGLLGVIPGVKGLTTLSKLSALYKAGGVKEIAKAALTGMKNMAKDMVGVVKAAGNGAVTIVKKLGDTGSVLGAIKSTGVILSDVVRTGGAKLGELFPGGTPKLVRDLPTPATVDKTFGMPAPNTLAGGGAKTFVKQFDDLKAAQTATEHSEVAKIQADYLGKFHAEEIKINKIFDDNLKLKTEEINKDYAKQLETGTLKIENTYTDNLKIKTDEIKADYAGQLKAHTEKIDGEFAAAKQAKFDELRTTWGKQFDAKAAELQQAHDIKLADLDRQLGQMNEYRDGLNAQLTKISEEGGDVQSFFAANKTNFDEVVKLHDAVTAEKTAVQTQLKTDLEALKGQTEQLAQTDLDSYLTKLDGLREQNLTEAKAHFDANQTADIGKVTKELGDVRNQELVDLTNRLDGAKTTDINAATAALEKIRTTDIDAAKANFDKMYQADVNTKLAQIQANFAAQNNALNHQMLDTLADSAPLANGGSVNVLHLRQGVDAGDLDLVIQKNAPGLDMINLAKSPNDVNCTICVQRVDEYLRTGNVTTAQKISQTQPLSTIEANYPGRSFNQVNSYDDIVKDMAGRPDGTVGIVGFKNANSNDGHVWNVWRSDGRIMFLDGQTGKLGQLPQLNPGDYLGFMPTT